MFPPLSDRGHRSDFSAFLKEGRKRGYSRKLPEGKRPHLRAGQLVALFRLGALHHLGPDLVRVDKAVRGHTATSGGNLNGGFHERGGRTETRRY